MDRSIRLKGPGERADFLNGYELEQQLKVAERRYSEARGTADKAREELRTLNAQPDSSAQAVARARERFEAADARCARLRTLIESLEEDLDV
jgi:chromosome segregation ATPase